MTHPQYRPPSDSDDDPISRLAADPEASMSTVMATINGLGLPRAIDGLFDLAAAASAHGDPDTVLACARLVERIQDHTTPRRPGC
jgi:hypothetical protein